MLLWAGPACYRPADSESDEDDEVAVGFNVAAAAEAVARQLALEGGRDQSYRGAKGRSIRYKEFSESGERYNNSGALHCGSEGSN